MNDQGQYITQQQPQPQTNYINNHQMYVRENSQTQLMQNNQYAPTNQYQQYHQNSNHYREPYGYQQDHVPQKHNNTFFLHDQQTPPQPTQRRTWAQSAQMQEQQNQPELTTWGQSKIDSRTWKSPSHSVGENHKTGFILHQNGGSGDYTNPEQSYQNLFPVHASPQHRAHRQISQMMSNSPEYRDNRMQMTPSDDVMAPQSISFIGDEDAGDEEITAPLPVKPTVRPRTAPVVDQQSDNTMSPNSKLELNLAKLNITSGNRTYRIPSPTRPSINPNSFQVRII